MQHTGGGFIQVDELPLTHFGLRQRHDAFVEVNIGPLRPEKLTDAPAGKHRQLEKTGCERVVVGIACLNQGAALVWGKKDVAGWGLLEHLKMLGRVVVYQVPFICLREDVLHQGGNAVGRCGCFLFLDA